jgi:hypothetical protein
LRSWQRDDESAAKIRAGTLRNDGGKYRRRRNAVRQERLGYLDDHLPKMASRLEVFVCLDRLVEPENPIYHRLNPGNIHEAHQLLQGNPVAD